jgi:SAM-dependent methyltransferase
VTLQGGELVTEAFRGIVADLGAGAGSFLDAASSVSVRSLRPALLVEVDIDPAPPGTLSGPGGPGDRHVVRADLDGGRLPFRAGVIDAVVCNHALEHLTRPRELLRECHDALRPGGVLVAAVPNGSSVSDRLFRVWHRLFHGRGRTPSRHVQRFERAGLLALLAEEGFEVLSVETIGEAWTWLGKHAWARGVLLGITRSLRPLAPERLAYGWRIAARKPSRD